MNALHRTLLIGAAVVSLGGAAYAAQGDKAPDGQPGTKQDWKHGHGKFDPAKFKEHMAKRQKELHDKLKLTAAQEPAWATFTAAVAPPADMGKRPDRAEWDKLSAPERMEKRLGMMKEHEARMASRLQATKTFYAQLTPEQQKVFNDNVGKGHHRHGHRHGRG
jgi:protein CpxP